MAADAMRFLTVPPSREVAEQGLNVDLRTWFAAHLGAPTVAQRFAWPAILGHKHFLLSSPTGSGKTLAAFVPILSQILTRPGDGLRCLYVAPLKALCRDVGVNLKKTWRSLQQSGFFPAADVRIGLRTGDTSQRVRQRHRLHPPAILLTTPESLAQMLAHAPSQEMLRSARCLVLDEIHALVGNKRGADLALSVERLDALTGGRLQRIGLSATCAPLGTVAEFLAGADRACTVANVGEHTEKRFVIEPLFDGAEYSAGWLATLLDRLESDLFANRTTLIFTNTRNLAERLTWALRRRYPERADDIAVHHSAISAARRRSVERRLKQGRLWAVVSSTSLELGIDIGTVDQVVFVHPPGAVVRLLQRVGRSGHRPGEPRRGLLLTASASELLEAVVTAGSGRDGQIENVRTIAPPLDVLCQQLVGMAMTGAWLPDEAFALIRRATPFAKLPREDFQDCLDYLSGRRRDGTAWLPARLGWQGGRFSIIDPRTAKLLRRNLGVILTEDACTIRLRAPGDPNDAPTKALGEVDQAYAERLQPGDRFVLDGRCLELKKRESADLLVEEAFGRPQVPRWLGTGAPMPSELARRIFVFRAQGGEMLRDGPASLQQWLDAELNSSPSHVGDLHALVRPLPLPLYSGGEGWGEGVSDPTQNCRPVGGTPNPLTPAPLPLSTGGEGMKCGSRQTNSASHVGDFHALVRPLPLPLYSGGEGWGAGVSDPTRNCRPVGGTPNPLTPTPLPLSTGGEGMKCGSRQTNSAPGTTACTALAEYLQQQETVSEIPTLQTLLIECVAMQSCSEYFLHTPLPRAANEAIARVLLERRRDRAQPAPLALATNLGIYLVLPGVEAITAQAWRSSLDSVRFLDDLRAQVKASELLANCFGRVAQTGLMVLRHPLGGKRKVGGKDWAERRLFEQIRGSVSDFVLLRQAEYEAIHEACDAETAHAYLETLARLPIRVRHLAEPSPFGASLLGDGFTTTAITGAAAETP